MSKALTEMTDQQYIEEIDSIFGGDESEVVCRTIKVISVRKEHDCMCPACNYPSAGYIPHKITVGERAVVERAIVDGTWGASYICLPCLLSWHNHCATSAKFCARQGEPKP